jgi:pimeloyl-ACP methyl ester carboxylesterase
MEEKIPNSGLAVINGTGHFSFLEQPAVFKNIMRSYFGIGVGK